ncbi:TPA: hypothetical protein F6W67_02250 [Serratia marcescens]|nr:hypothetical protein [Serratia marcescens]EGT3598466.1 hypothetical protein [Serratia marcescens]HAU4290748.1 hypothetical protein [Serratia marcescens]HAU4297598.1 hypothetical protein [Serratia marcescens]HAU4313035.1 hypothetical protein [Serratia marcescens]
MTGVKNLPGADLNAACSGPEGVRPMDGPSHCAANTEATSSMTGITLGGEGFPLARHVAPLPIAYSFQVAARRQAQEPQELT